MSKLQIKISKPLRVIFSTIYSEETHVIEDTSNFDRPRIGETIILPGVPDSQLIVYIYHNYKKEEIRYYYGPASTYNNVTIKKSEKTEMSGLPKKAVRRKKK